MKRTRNSNAGELRSYSIGLALALVLTAMSFALAAWPLLDRQVSLAVIASAALVQALVHLRFFLRIDMHSTPRENLLALAFAVVLIVIMIGGSLWIMIDLHHRMAA